MGMKPIILVAKVAGATVSVLNREPMGMKLELQISRKIRGWRFSAQPRADGDEAYSLQIRIGYGMMFQCSTASRWG